MCRMLRLGWIMVLCLALGSFAWSGEPAQSPPAPASLKIPPTVGNGLGVNIHFCDPKPGEMAMLRDAGFKWVRMDFHWGGTEREKGRYDFRAYERLLKSLDAHGMRAMLILDYGNPLYDEGLSPHTEAGRQAFARWAAAAAVHFKGRGILWEMWNEPNIHFWKPKPNPDDYAKLALEVGKALRQAAPGEPYIGPATSEIDLKFLESCFKAGLLEYWSAVSVHPYRQGGPESAAADYKRLREMIARYAPPGREIPILAGEWGYSAAWKNSTEAKQGKMLAREFLTNLSDGIPLTIWYDWHDDGTDTKDPEHHFGTVANRYFSGRDPVYDPKPAYLAAKILSTLLSGCKFEKRMASDKDDCVLQFSRKDHSVFVAWTTAKEPRTVAIPFGKGRFLATDHLGRALPPAENEITLTDAPVYYRVAE